MEINEFIKNFADQFDETDLKNFTTTTKFRDLDEWSSLNALALMNMIGKKYKVIIKHDELKKIDTIQELFNLVNSKFKYGI
jgi:acyl carrier protein